MNKIKLITFDFDGTLANSFQIALNAFNEVSEKYNYPKIDEEKIIYWKINGVGELMKSFEIDPVLLPEFHSDAKRIMKEHSEDVGIYDGIKDLIKNLHEKGITLAIVSSNATDHIENFLKKESIFDYFNVIKSEKTFGTKAELLKSFDIDRSTQMHVGDDAFDVNAANEVGVSSVAVTWGFTDKAELKKVNPSFLIDKPAELLNILSQ